MFGLKTYTCSHVYTSPISNNLSKMTVSWLLFVLGAKPLQMPYFSYAKKNERDKMALFRITALNGWNWWNWPLISNKDYIWIKLLHFNRTFSRRNELHIDHAQEPIGRRTGSLFRLRPPFFSFFLHGSQWHMTLWEIWDFSRERSRSIYKSTRERVYSRN